MANSAFYRRRTEISTVKQAVVMLGIMQVKCLALSASIFNVDVAEDKYGFNFKELFNHFISVALGSRHLAEILGYEAPDEAFVAGLLHDMGIVYFIHHFPEDYAEVVVQANQFKSLIEAEQEILGINHAAIGGMMAQKWKFPERLSVAIEKHNEVPDSIETVELANIVQMSRLMNKPVYHNRPENLETRLQSINHLSDIMNIDRRQIDAITLSLLNETISTADYLGIDIGDTSEILMRANSELFNSYLTIENMFRERQELSLRILAEERKAAMLETKNIAIATLSHYINNAAMAISGRSQLMRMLITKGEIDDQNKRLDPVMEVMDKSVQKILAVLEELRELTNLDEMEKYSESMAINIDDQIKARLANMDDVPTDVITEPAASD
jgi:putative nucleotidyltransferase with HDIG domain